MDQKQSISRIQDNYIAYYLLQLGAVGESRAAPLFKKIFHHLSAENPLHTDSIHSVLWALYRTAEDRSADYFLELVENEMKINYANPDGNYSRLVVVLLRRLSLRKFSRSAHFRGSKLAEIRDEARKCVKHIKQFSRKERWQQAMTDMGFDITNPRASAH